MEGLKKKILVDLDGKEITEIIQIIQYGDGIVVLTKDGNIYTNSELLLKK